jgi:putative transferase (TIGR04331 family)
LANKCVFEDHELKISNRFLSWGSSLNNLNYKITSVGYIKFSLLRLLKTNFLRKINTPRKIIFINSGISRITYRLDDFIRPDDWYLYLSDIYNAIKNIDIQKKILIHNHPIRKNESDNFFLSKDSNLNLSKLDYSSFFNFKYLIISTYNATVFLEFIYYNIPTIIYLNPSFWSLRKESNSVFKKLSDVGVAHYDHNSLSNFINSNHDNITEWWFSNTVQIVLKEFKELYLNDINFKSIKNVLN